MVPHAQILLIEGKARDARSFAPELRGKKHNLVVATTGRQAKTLLESFRPDVVIMDASFFPSSGVRICKMIRTMVSDVPLIYISAAGRTTPPTIRPDIRLKHPFTIRKLNNRIAQLLSSTNGATYQIGPLTLYIDKRTLLKKQREHRLTPKQAQLLEKLVQNPGRVISRRELIKCVWETDFMEDTRTLDVHIRWVREKVEDDPSNPRYIITVRGQGYRFAIPFDKAPAQA